MATEKKRGGRAYMGNQIKQAAKVPCTWAFDDLDCFWRTDCGEAFVFNDGGPQANFMRFCCYCGKSLKEDASPTAKPKQE